MINNETDYNNNEEDIDMESLESKSVSIESAKETLFEFLKGVIKNGWLRIIQHLFYDQQYRRVLTKKLSSNNSIYTQTELSLLLRHAISWDQFYIAEFFVDQMGLK
ncbi:hypothetical protein DDB_G0272722 [Dictyostelium discoideum AX4]|uniref:Uncharacterized protein n=1 Tax=Dictyostelium discoideum TaxID=44689 RepID=Q86IJ7_DICDI|nr:hypothetical protein DDB_G0272722 [Dictyostelium discoideum AX4]EAL70998.1 hypothetical protein DDB_G0272722 [Dictyostelium discoideum AX4]|eukprot:XP_644857.1 hypothetical protein DDB_G0272722 [Dictyostelium discoideum AX4]